jgi:hypothetical protein
MFCQTLFSLKSWTTPTTGAVVIAPREEIQDSFELGGSMLPDLSFQYFA